MYIYIYKYINILTGYGKFSNIFLFIPRAASMLKPSEQVAITV